MRNILSCQLTSPNASPNINSTDVTELQYLKEIACARRSKLVAFSKQNTKHIW